MKITKQKKIENELISSQEQQKLYHDGREMPENAVKFDVPSHQHAL